MWEQGLRMVVPLPLAASSPRIPVCFAGVIVDPGPSQDEGSDLARAERVAAGDPPGLPGDPSFPPAAVVWTGTCGHVPF